MPVYEMVIRYESRRESEKEGTDRSFFLADSDNQALLVASAKKIHEKYGIFPGYFVRLTRIDKFPDYVDGILQSPQRETHILRRHWPETSTE